MRSLRIDGETDEQFVRRAERAALYVRLLVDTCLQNECVRDYIADTGLPLWTEEACRTNPTVRIEYEQAIAIGGIGECLQATKSKHWGEGPYVHPLRPDDELFPYRITYVYRDNSLYNRRFEQRRRMKELLGRRYRYLVEAAKYHRHTLSIFLDNLQDHERRVIERIFRVDPQTFRRACRGKIFLELPPRLVQLELEFDDEP